MLTLMAQRGRPPKQDDDPPISRSFDLPTSMNLELIELSRVKEIPQVKIVRDGLRHQMDVIKGKKKDPAKAEAIGKEVRLALVDAIREERQSGTFPVKLRDPDRERLEKVAEFIGYTEPQHLIEDVMRNLLRRPEEIQEMLLGPAIRELQAALLAEGKADIAKAGSDAKARTSAKIKALNDEPDVRKKKAA